MQIFGVGPLELLLILVLALVIMGPQDMVGTARKLGGWIYRMVRSPTWRAIMETTQEFRDLPTKIVRDAGLDEAIKEIKNTADQVKSEMEATTREISSEMQAATTEINREISSAGQAVTSDLQKVAAESTLAAGVAPFVTGASPLSNVTGASPVAGDGQPQTGTGLPADPAELTTGPSSAEINPDSILWPEAATQDLAQENSILGTPSEPEPAAQNPTDPYVTRLETFAQALGGPMKNSAGLEQIPAPKHNFGLMTPAFPQTITPEMIANAPATLAAGGAPSESISSNGDDPEAPVTPESGEAPVTLERGETPVTLESGEAKAEVAHPWAPGLTIGSPIEIDMQARFQEQMDQMKKKFEELDARIQPAAEPTLGDEPAEDPSIVATLDEELPRESSEENSTS